ncbi:hypothetical protein EON83_18750 [bacterium]|nr:MAG: hypothetical protein EON83_18750 [bacterium]
MNINNKTYVALLARNFQSDHAESLVRKGYTLEKLKIKSHIDLEKLGLSASEIQGLFDEARPPIPTENLIEVLHQSRWTCCICRDRTNPVIVHHIKPWHESRDHTAENLAVLCPNDHARAHTRSELTLELSPERLKASRDAWLKQVEKMDAQALLGLSTESTFDRWHYFNHHRMMEMARRMKISLTDNRFFSSLRRLDILDDNGLLNDPSQWQVQSKPTYYLYDCIATVQLYAYMDYIWSQVLENIPLVNISEMWNRIELQSVIKPGRFIACEGAFYFKHSDKNHRGFNQTSLGYRRTEDIRLEFQFDAWDCTSSSARASYMTGRKRATVVCLVANIDDAEILKITASCLAIGFPFEARKANGVTDFLNMLYSNEISEIYDDSDPFADC